ncbi:MAG: DUF393 domain-containing protein [Acidobacteria bacterium]|nr:DUF393 domain-containing protein [Acidobacteriota bacterium]
MAARVSWNPFCCGGTALSPHLLLMAKLIALCLLLTNHVRLLTEPFLPFLPFFNHLPPVLFQRTLQTVFVASALALLFNRSVRLSCFLLGFTIILGVVSSKAYYGNNKFFCGAILFLTSLNVPWLLKAQMVLVYFGAGINKLFDPDWQSGQFFEHWARARLKHGLYIAAASWLPPLLLGKFMCWTTTITELGLSAGFAVRRLYPWAIWGNILYQSALMLFTGSTFTMFFYAMTAASFVLVDWPKDRLTVIYDGDCGFCNKCRERVERFDLERLLVWAPFQTGVARRHGISDAAVRERMYLVAGDKIYAGFAAFKMMALYNPVTYLAMAVLLAAPPESWANFRRVVVVLLLALFSPLFAPVGEAVYDLVARNRHRLSAQSCKV